MSGMNLATYELDELLLTALRSEIEAARIYARLGRTVKNAFLRDRFSFLAREERKHRSSLSKLFRQLYPDRPLNVPRKTAVPLPEIEIGDEAVRLSEVLNSAMKAEQAAYVFYKELALLFPKRPELRNLLFYFASMEQGHYWLLAEEKTVLERMEEWGEEQEMVHVGP
jgi:rubrerythrin